MIDLIMSDSLIRHLHSRESRFFFLSSSFKMLEMTWEEDWGGTFTWCRPIDAFGGPTSLSQKKSSGSCVMLRVWASSTQGSPLLLKLFYVCIHWNLLNYAHHYPFLQYVSTRVQIVLATIIFWGCTRSECCLVCWRLCCSASQNTSPQPAKPFKCQVTALWACYKVGFEHRLRRWCPSYRASVNLTPVLSLACLSLFFLWSCKVLWR